MTLPETEAYLTKARQALKEARIVLTHDLTEAAGRAAYIAAFHAAQAYIFDSTSRVAKSHSGVRSEFARLARSEPRIDRSYPTFLARAYGLKEIADYAIGHNIGISMAEAEQAIEIATQFVEGIAQLLEDGAP